MWRLLRSKDDFKQTILRNQLTSLVLFESIKTTSRASKDLIAYTNRFFNNIKDADLNAKKLAHRTLFSKMAIAKCFEEILPRYKHGETTFVKRYNTTNRTGDNAPMSLVMLTKPLVIEEKSPKKEKAIAKKETK